MCGPHLGHRVGAAVYAPRRGPTPDGALLWVASAILHTEAGPSAPPRPAPSRHHSPRPLSRRPAARRRPRSSARLRGTPALLGPPVLPPPPHVPGAMAPDPLEGHARYRKVKDLNQGKA